MMSVKVHIDCLLKALCTLLIFWSSISHADLSSWMWFNTYTPFWPSPGDFELQRWRQELILGAAPSILAKCGKNARESQAVSYILHRWKEFDLMLFRMISSAEQRKNLRWSPAGQSSLKYFTLPCLRGRSAFSALLLSVSLLSSSAERCRPQLVFWFIRLIPYVIFVLRLACTELIRTSAEEYDFEIRRILSPASNDCRSVSMSLVNSDLPSAISTETYKSKGTVWLYHRHTILAIFFISLQTQPAHPPTGSASHSTSCQKQNQLLCAHKHTHSQYVHVTSFAFISSPLFFLCVESVCLADLYVMQYNPVGASLFMTATVLLIMFWCLILQQILLQQISNNRHVVWNSSICFSQLYRERPVASSAPLSSSRLENKRLFMTSFHRIRRPSIPVPSARSRKSAKNIRRVSLISWSSTAHAEHFARLRKVYSRLGRVRFRKPPATNEHQQALSWSNGSVWQNRCSNSPRFYGLKEKITWFNKSEYNFNRFKTLGSIKDEIMILRLGNNVHRKQGGIIKHFIYDIMRFKP